MNTEETLDPSALRDQAVTALIKEASTTGDPDRWAEGYRLAALKNLLPGAIPLGVHQAITRAVAELLEKKDKASNVTLDYLSRGWSAMALRMPEGWQGYLPLHRDFDAGNRHPLAVIALPAVELSGILKKDFTPLTLPTWLVMSVAEKDGGHVLQVAQVCVDVDHDFEPTFRNLDEISLQKLNDGRLITSGFNHPGKPDEFTPIPSLPFGLAVESSPM